MADTRDRIRAAIEEWYDPDDAIPNFGDLTARIDEALGHPGPVQMVRPPWEEVRKFNYCTRHEQLTHTIENHLTHWQQGCFDYPIANAATELEALRAEVRRLMQLGQDGEFIYHRQAANRWAAGYPHIAAALREEKP